MKSAPIDTRNVTDRRAVRFQTIPDLLVEIDRIVAAEQAGKLRRTGNWTTGQTFGHIAAWVDYAYEGYPVRAPWFIKLILRLRRNRYLRGPLPVGVRLPGVADGTYGTEPLSLEEGAARLRAALRRLAVEPARFASPAFGPLSDAERIQLNLRHAELHLGFLHPET
jgi:hypothetical protein